MRLRRCASVLECGCPENVSEVSKSARRENFSHAFKLWRIFMNRVGSFGGPKMSFETVSPLPLLEAAILAEMKPISDCRLYAFVDTAYLHGRAPENIAEQ